MQQRCEVIGRVSQLHHPICSRTRASGFAGAQVMQLCRLLLHGALQCLCLLGVSYERVFGWQLLLLLQPLTPAADAGALFAHHVSSTFSVGQARSRRNALAWMTRLLEQFIHKI